MKYDQHLTTLPWADYELLDSGENMKLERYGEIIIARPETQAVWAKMHPEKWSAAKAVFTFGDAKGAWEKKGSIPEAWEVSRGPIKFYAKLTGFKHTGIFPEQEPNWMWVKDQVRNIVAIRESARKQSGPTQTGDPRTFSQQTAEEPLNVLNLFGYTGIASVAAAHAGAFVTHVDASKQSLDWAHENARLTGVGEDKVRWILDDALAFVKREVRRGTKYDGIILDPPAFGRGAKGEVWKVEEDLLPLLTALKELLSDKPGAFFLLNGYAAGYAPLSFAQAVESVFGTVAGDSGELRINETDTNRAIPAGIYVRFVR